MTDATPGSDQSFLGLEQHGDGRSSFVLTPPLARLDGKFFGGTAVAVAVTAMEAETGRDARWITVQFVASADTGEVIECETEELARGRRVSQVRVTGRVGDRIVFCAVGASADAKPGGFTGQYETMPEVLAPELSPPFDFLRPQAIESARRMGRLEGFQKVTEFRWGHRPEVAEADGRIGIWARIIDHPATPALLGFVADFVPMSVARAGGRVGAGTSLDNTMRFGPRITPEWVLVDLDPHLATDGYGHGTVHLWSPDGTLLATGSQTASMLFFD